MVTNFPQVSVNVRSIAFGGSGVGEVVAQSDGGGEFLGITAFVPFTAPGEQIIAQILEVKKRFVIGSLVSVKVPSPQRVVAPCPYYEQCGGCDLQHLSYRQQLAAKEEMLHNDLLVARVPKSVLDAVRSIVPSQPWSFRRRITLHIDSVGKVGFYRTQSRVVVPIERCLVADARINEVLQKVVSLGPQLKGVISSVALEVDRQGVVSVFKSPYSLPELQIQQLLNIARGVLENVLIIAQGVEVGGFGRQILQLELANNVDLQVPAGYFSQVNWSVNQELVEQVVQLRSDWKGVRVLDLFAGAGNFSMPLAIRGAQVSAVETDQRLVHLGRESSRKYGFGKGLVFVEQSVERYLKSQGGVIRPDFVIADPPRSGLGSLASQLPASKHLVFVSCYLPSFIRDLKALLGQHWNLLYIQPFDMFAHTSYLEIVAVFEAP